jgi:hypothetical protein
MDEFSNFFWNKEKRFPVHKWHHYFEIYDRHFSKYKDTHPTIVEIGVAQGGSLEMWNDYFQGQCTIYGVDINPACKRFESEFPNVKIFIGDQGNVDFLNQIKADVPNIDILIDDGSHINSHVITTFEALYSNIVPGGTYLIEDLHTSYWEEYGGGLLRQGTSIEYLKSLIDKVNAKHVRDLEVKRFAWERPTKVKQIDTDFSCTTHSMHFYDSITVLEKHKTRQNTVEDSIRK